MSRGLFIFMMSALFYVPVFFFFLWARQQYFACLHTKYHICRDCFIKKAGAAAVHIFHLPILQRQRLPTTVYPCSTCLALAPPRSQNAYTCVSHKMVILPK